MGITIDQNFSAGSMKMFDIQPVRAKQLNDDSKPVEKDKLKEVNGKIGWLGRGTGGHNLIFCSIRLNYSPSL